MTAQDVASGRRRYNHTQYSYPQRDLDDLPAKVREILSAVAFDHRIGSPRVLLSRTRVRPVMLARREVCVRLRAMEWAGGNPSLITIGQWLGLDHTTVLHALKRAAQP
jgi:chromosomal replication initiation ATPase DnaA